MDKEDLPEVLTIRELARILRIGLNSAYNLVRQGQVKSVKIGKQYRIPRRSVQEYMEAAK